MVLSLSACFLTKKKCDCPSFGHRVPAGQHHPATVRPS